jgi:hypothetical protein
MWDGGFEGVRLVLSEQLASEVIMADITDYEQNEVDQANRSGKTPVAFIHGLWLLPSSWDRWR